MFEIAIQRTPFGDTDVIGEELTQQRLQVVIGAGKLERGAIVDRLHMRYAGRRRERLAGWLVRRPPFQQPAPAPFSEAQFGDQSAADQAPAFHDGDFVAEPGQLGENVRGDQNGLAGRAQFQEEIAQLDSAVGIQTAGGFVQ